MSGNRQPSVRKYMPDDVCLPLVTIFNGHFTAVMDKDGSDVWASKIKIWNLIFDNLREHDQIYGTIRVFQSIRFIEALATDDDDYFKVASMLLLAPLVEDFTAFNGFFNSLEDFFLKTYGLAHLSLMVVPPIGF
jgi:hypothetical protein